MLNKSFGQARIIASTLLTDLHNIVLVVCKTEYHKESIESNLDWIALDVESIKDWRTRVVFKVLGNKD